MEPVEVRLKLITSWSAWEAKPSNEYTAKNMCDACNAYSAQLGVSATKLRIKLAELRLLGLAGAVDAAKLEFEIEQELSDEPSGTDVCDAGVPDTEDGAVL